MKRKAFIFSLLMLWLFSSVSVFAKDKMITLEYFLNESVSRDQVFEQILIDQMTLKYQKSLKLPAKDLVLSVKTEYDLYLNQNRSEPETSISLTRLFPLTATELSAEYSVASSQSTSTESSDLTFMISQPIAENAFGRSTRLLDKIVGLEVDVTRYQIIEAYEDYFASTVSFYYEWYEAYENLKIGEASYRENLKLLDNIKARQDKQIALPIDVNKITLQVMGKEEALIDLREKYKKTYNIVCRSLRYDGNEELIPQTPQVYFNRDVSFDKQYALFKNQSRTYQVLDLLEKKSSLQVEREADDLLPSIDLNLGYKIDGDNFNVNKSDSLFFASVTMDWPIGDQIDRAQREIAKINEKKTRLTTKNTHYQLFSDIQNLSFAIGRESELLKIADKKIVLAQQVLDSERENYSFGKVTLNDYIQAVNALDSNRFNKIRHEVLLRKLKIEWLRITDQLIDKSIVTN